MMWLLALLGCAATEVGPEDLAPTLPKGPFVAVAAGISFGCATRELGSVECWGKDDLEQTAPPSARYTEVQIMSSIACGRTDSRWECWGNDETLDTDTRPADWEQSLSFSVGSNHACALTVDGAAVCWGRDAWGETEVPEGTFASIYAGAGTTCALDFDGRATCWGYDDHDVTTTPTTEFASLATGAGSACGLTAGGRVECWGQNVFSETESPPGTFTQVVSGGNTYCALDTDGLATCWGLDIGRTPRHSYKTIAVGTMGCGTTTDDVLECWGNENLYGELETPE